MPLNVADRVCADVRHFLKIRNKTGYSSTSQNISQQHGSVLSQKIVASSPELCVHGKTHDWNKSRHAQLNHSVKNKLTYKTYDSGNATFCGIETSETAVELVGKSLHTHTHVSTHVSMCFRSTRLAKVVAVPLSGLYREVEWRSYHYTRFKQKLVVWKHSYHSHAVKSSFHTPQRQRVAT